MKVGGWKVVSAAGREAEGYSASVSPGWRLEGWKVVSAAGREAEGYSASVSPGWKNLVIYQPVNL